MAPTLRLRAASMSPPRPTMNSVLPPPMSTTSTCWSNTGTAWSTPRWMSRASSTPEITSTPTLALTRAASRNSSRFSASRTALVATAWTSAPNVARYRKEATGGIDDAQLRTLEERLRYLRELEERRAQILESIEAQGKLDDALRAQVMAADSKARLEDIYLPYKPKRRTKA